MIQRIQSLYLLLAALLAGLTAYMPLARYFSGGEEFVLTSFGLEAVAEGKKIAYLPYLGILGIIVAVLLFATIFLYRNRLLQIRITLTGMVLLAGMLALTGYYIYHGGATFKAAADYASSYGIACIFPLIALILAWLAVRRIGKDEALVRSLDRIR